MKQKGEKPMFNTIQCNVYETYTLNKINTLDNETQNETKRRETDV